MVHPLVSDHQRPFDLTQLGDGVFCQNRKSVGGDQFRDTVVDLRVHMVGTARQYDAAAVVFFHPLKCFLALFLHVPAGSKKLLPRLVSGFLHLIGRNLELFVKDFDQPLRQHLFVGKRHKRIEETNVFRIQLLHVVFDILGVGRDDRTVEMVAGVRRLIALVRNAGIKNRLNPLLDQPFDMAVGDLGRIAFRFAGDRFDSQLVYFPGGLRRKDRAELQFF